jgi:hypothetical protein
MAKKLLRYYNLEKIEYRNFPLYNDSHNVHYFLHFLLYKFYVNVDENYQKSKK